MDPESSPGLSDEPAAESSPAPDVSAESSPAEGEAGPRLEDAVDAALRSESDPESPTGSEADQASEGEPEAKAEAEDSESESSEFSDEELGLAEDAKADKPEHQPDEQLPFHKHPRWQEVQRELKEARTKAEQYDQIRTFMERMEVSETEVANGMVLAAKVKAAAEGRPGVNPEDVLGEVDAWRNQLLSRLGRAVLPDELQAKVDDGEIDEETARRLVTLESEARRAKELEQRQALEREQAERHRHIEQMQSLANSFEQALRKRDPDYDRKAALVRDKVRLKVSSQGLPKDRDATLQLLRDAYREVNEQVRAFVPRGSFTSSTASSRDSRASENVVGPPKSPLEAVERVLSNR